MAGVLSNSVASWDRRAGEEGGRGLDIAAWGWRTGRVRTRYDTGAVVHRPVADSTG